MKEMRLPLPWRNGSTLLFDVTDLWTKTICSRASISRAKINEIVRLNRSQLQIIQIVMVFHRYTKISHRRSTMPLVSRSASFLHKLISCSLQAQTLPLAQVYFHPVKQKSALQTAYNKPEKTSTHIPDEGGFSTHLHQDPMTILDDADFGNQTVEHNYRKIR